MPTITNITTTVSGFTTISQHQHPSSHLTVLMPLSNFELNIYQYSHYSASWLTFSKAQNLQNITAIIYSYRERDITTNILSTVGIN